MKFTKKHRKLFYVPGMISLVLVPVLCMWFINSNRHRIDIEHSIDFRIFNSISDIKPNPAYNWYSDSGYVPKRNYKTFLFNGIDDDTKIKLAITDLKRLVKTNDTVKGIKFTFGKHSKYEHFITTQDILFSSRVDNFTFYKNDIYVFEMPKIKSGKEKIVRLAGCGGNCFVDNSVWLEEERIRKQKFFIQNIKSFWQIPLALLGMIILNIFALIKFNRNRFYNQKSYI